MKTLEPGIRRSVTTAILMLGNGIYGVPVYDKLTEMAGSRVNQLRSFKVLPQLLSLSSL
jgi:hypothetical protein